MRLERNWVVWRWELAGRVPRWSKVPYTPRAGTAKARSDDPATWRDLERAWAAWVKGECDGIGLMRTGRRLFLDIDGCLREDGEWAAWDFPGPRPQAVAEALSGCAWMEKSPSSTGVHLIFECEPLPPGPRRFDFAAHRGFEWYDRERFLAITGHTLFASSDLPRADGGRALPLWQACLSAKLGELHTKPVPNGGPARVRNMGSDERFRHLLGFEEYRALWAGEWEGRYASQSEAELAWFSKLARNGFSPEEAEGLYLASGLAREKWAKRPDYAKSTLGRAYGR